MENVSRETFSEDAQEILRRFHEQWVERSSRPKPKHHRRSMTPLERARLLTIEEVGRFRFLRRKQRIGFIHGLGQTISRAELGAVLARKAKASPGTIRALYDAEKLADS